MVSRGVRITGFWIMAFMVLMGAGCGTLSITLDGQDTEEPEVDSTALALQAEISILATLASTNSPQETVTPEATQSAQSPETSAEWSMNPIAGLFYRTDQALWQLDAEGNPQELMSLEVGMEGFQISPEGDRVLYSYRDDIWVADLTSGEQVNITQTDDRRESKPYWWPARPETILFNSAVGSETKGKLAASNLDGSAYQIIGDRAMFAPPAPSEDRHGRGRNARTGRRGFVCRRDGGGRGVRQDRRRPALVSAAGGGMVGRYRSCKSRLEGRSQVLDPGVDRGRGPLPVALGQAADGGVLGGAGLGGCRPGADRCGQGRRQAGVGGNDRHAAEPSPVGHALAEGVRRLRHPRSEDRPRDVHDSRRTTGISTVREITVRCPLASQGRSHPRNRRCN